MVDFPTYDVGDSPTSHSHPTKLKAREDVYAAVTGIPLGPTVGYDVRDWALVLVRVHPTAPTLAAPAANWKVVLRPWKWVEDASQGTGSAAGATKGQWYALPEWTVPLDGATTTDTMEKYFRTPANERLYMQVVSTTDAPANWQFAIGMYGVLTMKDLAAAAPADAESSAASSGGISALPLAFDECLYSNVRGDFTITRLTGATFTIVGLTNFIPTTENIYAIGIGLAAGGIMTYYYRGANLNCTFDEATGILTTSAAISGLATDNIEIYIEGPPRAMDPAFNARREIVVNPDSLHNSTTARIFDQDVIGPADQAGSVVYYAPFNMADGGAGYHQLEAQVRIAHVDGGTDHEENVYVGIEATNDVFPNDLDCTWTDVFDEVFNDPIYAGWMADITNPLDYPLIPVKGLHWRRMRWRITALTTEHEPQDFHVGQARVIIRQTRTAIDAPASVDRRLQLLMQPVNLAMHQEDVGAVSGDYGVLALERRQDTIPGTPDPNADTDYAFPNQTARGNSKCEDPVSADDSTHWSPQDGTTVPTGAGVATITCSGFPFTVDDTNCHIDMVVIKLAAPGIPPNETRVFVNGKGGVSISATNNVITMYGHGYGNFVGTETVYVYLTAQEKGFTAGSNSFRGEDIFPLNMKFTEDSLVDGVVNDIYTYHQTANGLGWWPGQAGGLMAGYAHLSLTGYIDGVADRTITLIVEGTNDEAPTTSATPGQSDWIQLYGWRSDANANVNVIQVVGNVIVTFAWDFDLMNYKFFRIHAYSDVDNTDGVEFRLKLRRMAVA